MVMSTDPVEQFLIEVHSLRDRDGRLAAYRLGEDLQDEIRIAQILVAKITAMERERIKAANAPEIEKVNALLAMQVRPSEFAQLVKGKEALLGMPAYWAEWPNKEQP